MEYIVLDTNIFIKENFLEGKRILQLLKLSEEEKIKIVMTKITIGEVKSRFKKFSGKAVQDLNEFKNQFESRVLRNNSAGKKIFERIVNKDIEKEFNDEFDAILLKSKILVIDYRELNIETVFEKYFKNEFPFNGGDKKNEFPDAFTLDLIEKWCIEKKIKCTVFSSDKDFLNFESEHFEITKDYENYLDEKLKYYLTEEHRISVLNKLFAQNSKKIDDEIEEWYRYKLDDDSLYHMVVWNDIHDIEISEVIVKNKSFQIVSIDKESIEIEIEADVTFKVELVIDDEDFSHYDNEDKVTYYFETKIEEIERDVTATLLAIAYIIDKNDYEEEFEILEINRDEKLRIEEQYEDYR
ncbi:PIN domain-containing protein [Aequorivita sp. CIP111184]|uniref:PIN domain-containing protein n=1 Tax=Aequorivita sp. CIP111184 TaxID=2211356 RepID=UPI000DBBFF5D|nr:PIN domain-containing protein [Aequorivita sp. CIP111184]SRX51995.1 hypothetical protein AEQU1_00055 [Aequorivita sp. CIP111184]